MNIFFAEDKSSFERDWSSKAGIMSGLQQAATEAERRSAIAFIARKDEVATALRDLALELRHKAKHYSEEVQAYVAEAARRQHEINKVLR